MHRYEAMHESLSQRLDEVYSAMRGSKQHWKDTWSGIPPQVSSSSSQSKVSSQYQPSSMHRDEISGLARNEEAYQEKIKRYWELPDAADLHMDPADLEAIFEAKRNPKRPP